MGTTSSGDPRTRPPFAVYLLAALLAFESIGAFYGSITMLLAPDGSIIQMPLSFLDRTPFCDFLVPAVILFLFLGLLPALVSYGLLARPEWNLPFCIYKDRHWSWTYALFTAFGILIWIDVELWMVQVFHPLQTIIHVIALSVLALALLPAVQRYYTVRK